MDNIATIADMIRDAERHADDLQKSRIRATEYYRGEMNDTPSDQGRSGMTTRDVRAQVKKVLPSVMRTLLGSEKMVEYLPVGEGDEEGADQATDYVNHVVARETNLRRQIEDALHDALLLRNGILTWFWEDKKKITVSEHTGLTEDAFLDLVGDDDVEILEHSQEEELIEVEGADGMPVLAPITLHDVTIKRVETDGRIKVDAVPREQFLIHSDAVTIEDSPVVGRVVRLTRSDLVAMGYDIDKVNALPLAGEDNEDDDRRAEVVTDASEPHRPNEPVDYYDVYIRFDADGDGIAELHHMCFGGDPSEKTLLMDDFCDEVQYCDIKVMSQPHQWEGISLADDMMDIQQVKTVLVRQTLDNLYGQNNPQPVIQEGAIRNPDAVLNPEFGLPIRVREGVRVSDAYSYNAIPFVAAQSFGMLSYMDEEATNRTGVSDASSGMAPDALQNMTAKASAMIEQAGIGQTELMVTTAAEGLRRLFRGILKLVITHQDVERTVRLRGEWVRFDPRQWNAAMDCDVNVGLGAGTRERDVMVMQTVMALQEKLLAAFGAQNPFVKPENLWNSLVKMIEAAGLKSPDMFFTEPDPEEIQALMQERAQQQDPAAIKAQADAQLAAQKLQLEAKKAEMEFQLEQQRLAVEMQDSERKAQIELLKAQNESASLQLKAQEFEWAKMSETAKMQQMAAEYGLKDRRLQLDAIQAGRDAELKATDQERQALKDAGEMALAMREASMEETQQRPVALGPQ